MTEESKALRGECAKTTWMHMEADRWPYLQRARDVALLTLPHLYPPDGWTGGDLGTPFQSIGARGLISLVSKVMLALFPPNQSFLRLKLGDEAERMVEQAPGSRTEIEKNLSKIERQFLDDVESQGLRPGLAEGIKHYFSSGNVTLHFPDKGGVKVYPLTHFVRKLDGTGRLMLLIMRDSVARAFLPEALRQLLKTESDTGPDQSAMVDLYTVVRRIEGQERFEVWQEAGEYLVPNSKGTYSADELPWITLGDGVVSGASYGYGYLASQLGDLSSLEGLMKSLVEGSAASARVIFLVSPTAQTKVTDLNRAPNGSFVSGQEGDIVALQVDKSADLSVADSTIQRLGTSLGFAFLLNQSVQRSGERVTAEEIRFLAQELEDVHAGMYSYLSQSLQLPMSKILLARMAKRGAIPKIDTKTFKFTIITGLEALGRGHDVQRLSEFMAEVTQLLGPQAPQYVNIHAYLKRKANALSIQDPDELLYDQQAQAEMMAQQQQAALAQQVAPEVVKQAGAAMQQPQ